MTKDQQLRGWQSATDENPRPGSFAVGSPKSRAAARALMNRKLESARKLDFVISVVGRPDMYNPPTIGEWRENPDGTMCRVSRIPWGITIQEAERMVV